MNRAYRWEVEALNLIAALTVAWEDGAIHGLHCLWVREVDQVGNRLSPRIPTAAEVNEICDAFLRRFDTGWWDTRETIERHCEIVHE